MNKLHKEIFSAIEQRAKETNTPSQHGNRYVGTSKPMFSIRAAMVGEMFREFKKRHTDLSQAEFVALLDSLARGKTYNEFIAVGVLLGAYPDLRAALDPRDLDRWLERAQGWAEVDVFCNNFGADEMLNNWKTWKSVLTAFTRDANVHKRRASLVLLVVPVRESDDARLAKLALANVDKLKHEKDILITKAVSWILRSLIKHHRAEVEAYLAANADTLPKIAIRETRVKLETGTKAGKTRSVKRDA
ncbi:MAG: DNA alkylation repair protein [Chloroflexi bacterium]|nr:DNA alkylation repair protein [Chloroflexota bacterium]